MNKEKTFEKLRCGIVIIGMISFFLWKKPFLENYRYLIRIISFIATSVPCILSIFLYSINRKKKNIVVAIIFMVSAICLLFF